MGKEKTTSQENVKKKKNLLSYRTLIVFAILVVYALVTFISLRADYLEFKGIDEKYVNIFFTNIKNKYIVAGVSFVAMYLVTYITNKIIKYGLKPFFEDEKKEMPKLPNKSFAILFGLIISVFAANMLTEKFVLFQNATEFVRKDPIFNIDIGFYFFNQPFIEALIPFLVTIIIGLIIYIAAYYVIALNTFFDGVDVELLKKSKLIKQISFSLLLAVFLICFLIFTNSQNILTQEMIQISDNNKTTLIGAGLTDVTIKVWGYRILAVVIFVASYFAIRSARKLSFKNVFLSVSIVPIYLILLFVCMIGFQNLYVKSNEFDKEKNYISHNLEFTKDGYGINIDEKIINKYEEITYNEITDNEDIINNIPLINEKVTISTLEENKDITGYYSYKNTHLSVYRIDGKNKLVYITPREIQNATSRTYNNYTYNYTHGYSAVVTSASNVDKKGNIEFIQSSFIEAENKLNISEPRIYFGAETDCNIVVGSDFGPEFDYPLTSSTNAETRYEGQAGLKLGFWDRVVLAIKYKDLKLITSNYLNENSKIITTRNITERAKKLLPNVIYDEKPYLVITDEGKMVWILDAYTVSDKYPYSQKTTISLPGGGSRDINYIRNSIKVLVDAYSGITKFYITDKYDPVAMAYRDIYPDLFEKLDTEIPYDIANHLKYPEFLFDVQAEMLKNYHDITPEVLLRADDIWEITSESASKVSTLKGSEIKPYYIPVKDSKGNLTLGLVIHYNKLGKQYLNSYVVGTVEGGKAKLSLYRFNDSAPIASIVQLNTQIEQDEKISKELEALNTTGTILEKSMILVPIDNSILYVEPVYQVAKNESQVPILKKIIVSTGSKVAIGDTFAEALTNLFSDEAVSIEIIDTGDLGELIDALIKARENLEESLLTNDWALIGKDLNKVNALISQIEVLREKQVEQEKDNEVIDDTDEPSIIDTLENILNHENEVDTNVFQGNVVEENTVQN